MCDSSTYSTGYSTPFIAKSFFDLLKIGLGGNYYKLFLDPIILLYVIIDSFLGYTLVNISNGLFSDLVNKKIVLWNIVAIIFLPLATNIINLLFNDIFLKKKVYVVNNILDYIKNIFSIAPYEFHDKFSIREKYICFTSSIWGFDSMVNVIISMCSSLVKIITISISLSLSNYYIGLLIIGSNIILLYLMPKINNYIIIKIQSHKKIYADAYYDTVISDEKRINPILNCIQDSNINESLKKIITRYSTINKNYEINNSIRGFIKNIFLSIILFSAFYQEKYNYIMILLLNKSIIFGFSDFYEEFKKSENSNKRNIEELLEMLNFLELYYKTNKKTDFIFYNNFKPVNLILRNMNYNFYHKNKLIKKLSSSELEFDFTNKKNIILISGKTGSGKSLFTKVLSGQLDTNEYLLFNDGQIIKNGFSSIIFNRIIINQKISEDYTYNGNIQMSLDKLYPQSNNFNEIIIFLKIFTIDNKLNTQSIDSIFSDNLSGGERQRVALSSIIWKILKTNPSFIIIDEPEKGIDEETMISIMDWIMQVYNGLVFLITHNETIKSKYHNQMQSIIKYRFKDYNEVDTEIYQEFL
jgi:ABC-type transport system involved in cytochrome bd biosynthesis fused ATPase/permease subunit